MVHGALIYPCFANIDVLNVMRESLWSFGKISDSVFYPYWKRNPYVQSSNDKVVFSYYEKKGKLFVILLNTTSQTQQTTLRLTYDYSTRCVGKLSATLYDPVTDQDKAVPLSQDKIDVALDAYLCKLLIAT